MNKFIKKILGIERLEKAQELLEKAEKMVHDEEVKRAAASRTPKEIATENKEPYVAVLDTKINKDNVRNGFFELDWNEYFVMQLREAGYNGNSEEEIVDQWFTALCKNIGGEEGIDMERRGSGYVNRALRDDGRTEVS